MTRRILTKHPDAAKQGVNIERHKYDAMRDAIVAVLDGQGETTFRQLHQAVDEHLAGRFDGSVGWYYTTVKLDLEARGVIARVPNSRPQVIHLKRKSKRSK